LLATQGNWKSGGRVLALALLGGITLGPVFGSGTTAALAQAQSLPHTWLTLEDGSLCPAATTANPSAADSGDALVHCMQAWQLDLADVPVSDVRAQAPAADDAAFAVEDNAKPYPRLTHPLVTVHLKAESRLRILQPVIASHPVISMPLSAPGGPYNPWGPVPGHPGYAMSDFAGDPASSFFGYCTWYAWYRAQSESLLRLGMAAQWAANAPRYGLSTGTTPAVGATAVFQPGVEGAGGGGHAAHVEQVLGGGWFIVSEMNYILNGGGWGRIDWRYAYVTSGVSFIY
jgi:CHAP domain